MLSHRGEILELFSGGALALALAGVLGLELVVVVHGLELELVVVLGLELELVVVAKLVGGK